ncbi:hypothetical protein CES85_2933 (plasmid) [Ochrobactrum quorumnocens]|uniref:Uncharacterized protein n=1 Tax=Ochrobactrum quorumnocens TaxID=271865 RepID=A0A248UPI3_9HYPH|nr:hypothetical protein CES85_2933 [[Ochrobactrum] quorumnocens]
MTIIVTSAHREARHQSATVIMRYTTLVVISLQTNDLNSASG